MAVWIWVVIWVVGLTFEAYTILDRKRGTTFSAQIWRLRAMPAVRAILVAATAWLVYHFWFESPVAGTITDDDWALVTVGFLATFVRTHRKENVK